MDLQNMKGNIWRNPKNKWLGEGGSHWILETVFCLFMYPNRSEGR